MKSNVGTQIIEKAKEKGAAMAGIAIVELLKKSPSHEILNMKTGLEIKDFTGIKWPVVAKSALVIAVSHPENKPELDWWDVKGSPGDEPSHRTRDGHHRPTDGFPWQRDDRSGDERHRQKQRRGKD